MLQPAPPPALSARIARAINRAFRPLPAWPLYPALAGLVSWRFWQAASGALGPDPAAALERALGGDGLKLLLASLAITPLRRLLGINLTRYRRALGLGAFFLVSAHLLVWAVLDVQDISLALREMLRRSHIIAGVAAFALMLPLAATSFNAAIRRLGTARWRALHRAAYAIALLAVVHFILARKGWQVEPLAYAAFALALLAVRVPAPFRRPSRQGASRA